MNLGTILKWLGVIGGAIITELIVESSVKSEVKEQLALELHGDDDSNEED